MPERLRAHGRARGLERLHRRLRLALLALAHPREALVELLLAAEHVARRHAAVVEEHVGGVRGAQAVLGDLRPLRDALRPRSSARRTPRGRASRARGSTVAITTWTSAMPPFVAHAFWPLITHSPAASSSLARVRRPDTSEPAFGSEAQKAATLTSSGVPKQRGIHSPICSPEPWPKIAATASAVPMIDMPIPASPQNSSSLTIGSVRPRRVGEELREAFEPVQPDLGRLLDDRPRRLLLLVPLVGGRAHDVGGEAVHPVADVLLVLGEREREGHLLRGRLRDRLHSCVGGRGRVRAAPLCGGLRAGRGRAGGRLGYLGRGWHLRDLLPGELTCATGPGGAAASDRPYRVPHRRACMRDLRHELRCKPATPRPRGISRIPITFCTIRPEPVDLTR